MTGRENRQLETLKNLYQLCSGQFPKKIPKLSKQFDVQTARLGKTLAKLGEVQTTRVSGGPFQTTRAQRGLTVLTLTDDFLKPMRRIARVHSASVPGFAVPFVIPRPRSAVSDFVEAARSFALAAESHKEIFLDGSMEEDFVEQLRALADALEAQAGSAIISRTERGEAARESRLLLREGRQIAELLDTIFRRHYARLQKRPEGFPLSMGGVLAVWEKATHVQRDPVRRARRLNPVL